MLQGDFDASFTKADNRLVVATDSMKNTVNVLAKKKNSARKRKPSASCWANIFSRLTNTSAVWR